jgi:hypothetical protein
VIKLTQSPAAAEHHGERTPQHSIIPPPSRRPASPAGRFI